MNPGVLFVITTDPRTSPRPAEAARIAAGLSAWKTVAVTVYLRDAAVLALSEFPDELTDGHHFSRYLPLLAESGGLVCAERDAPLLGQIGQAQFPFRKIGDDEFAALLANNDYLIRL